MQKKFRPKSVGSKKNLGKKNRSKIVDPKIIQVQKLEAKKCWIQKNLGI